jgi:hypothetical protein
MEVETGLLGQAMWWGRALTHPGYTLYFGLFIELQDLGEPLAHPLLRQQAFGEQKCLVPFPSYTRA